jgi:hypothetical protein
MEKPMQIEVTEFDNIARNSDQVWSHGLYIWQAKRHSFDTRPANVKPTPSLYQVDFMPFSKFDSLADVVEHYRREIETNPDNYAKGKYNIRVLVDFERISVTMKVS